MKLTGLLISMTKISNSSKPQIDFFFFFQVAITSLSIFGIVSIVEIWQNTCSHPIRPPHTFLQTHLNFIHSLSLTPSHPLGSFFLHFPFPFLFFFPLTIQTCPPLTQTQQHHPLLSSSQCYSFVFQQQQKPTTHHAPIHVTHHPPESSLPQPLHLALVPLFHRHHLNPG